jgi:hypothetical protein
MGGSLAQETCQSYLQLVVSRPRAWRGDDLSVMQLVRPRPIVKWKLPELFDGHAMLRFRNFTPSNAIDSGEGAMSRQMEAAADSSPSAKPKLSMVSHPS